MEAKGFTKKVERFNFTFYITVSVHNGEPVQVFIKAAKQGSTVQGLVQVFAVTLSLALRGGVPWQKLRDHYLGMKFEPSEPDCPSIVHLIASEIENILSLSRSVSSSKSTKQCLQSISGSI